MAPVEVYAGVAYIQVGDVGIVLWTGDPTLAANRWVIQRFLHPTSAPARPSLGLQIIAESAGTPGPEARKYVQEAMRNDIARLRRFINAPLGDSFKQNVVRAILRGIALVADKTKVVVIASSIEEALDIVAANASSDTPPPPELSSTIDALFATMQTTRPRGAASPSRKALATPRIAPGGPPRAVSGASS